MAHRLDEKAPVSRVRHTFRRSAGLFLIFTPLFYFGDFAKTTFDFIHDVRTGAVRASFESYTQKMQQQVARQSAALEKVNPAALYGVYASAINDYDCSWTFVCHLRQFGPNDWIIVNGIPIGHKPRPLVTGGFPTGATIRGTPHAFGEMAAAIWDHGLWATGMFAACAILWLALWVMLSRWMLGTQHPMAVLLSLTLFVLSPAPVSGLVWCVQWVGAFILNHIGWPIALVAHVVAYGGAVAIAVGFVDTLRSPRELKEALEVLTKPRSDEGLSESNSSEPAQSASPEKS